MIELKIKNLVVYYHNAQTSYIMNKEYLKDDFNVKSISENQSFMCCDLINYLSHRFTLLVFNKQSNQTSQKIKSDDKII